MAKKNMAYVGIAIIISIIDSLNGMHKKQSWFGRLASYGKKPDVNYSVPITVPQQEEWPIPCDATAQQREIYEKINEKVRERNEQSLRAAGFKIEQENDQKNGSAADQKDSKQCKSLFEKIPAYQ